MNTSATHRFAAATMSVAITMLGLDAIALYAYPAKDSSRAEVLQSESKSSTTLLGSTAAPRSYR
jgi:hypothetical protein